MDSQWGSYVESAQPARQSRYYAAAPNLTSSQQPQRDPTTLSAPRQDSTVAVKQEPFTTPSISSRAASMAISSPPQVTRTSSYNNNGDGDGDVPMEDADPYRPKYARATGQKRNSTAYIQDQEASSAARRYSPMNLSPSSPYGQSSTQNNGAAYTSFSPSSSRQSPTRSNPYMSPPQSYYSPPCMVMLGPPLYNR